MVATEVQLVTPKVQSVCSSLMLHFLPIKQKRTKIGEITPQIARLTWGDFQSE